MRRFLVVTLLATALAGCAKAGSGWTIPGTLRIGEQQEPDSLNLMFGNNSATDEVNALLYSSLMRIDADGNLIPDLALDVPTQRNGGISSDGKTITVHLRHNVRWSDGQALTAADWLFTYRAVRNPRNNVKSDYGWQDIASANAPDPYTIVIRLKKPSVSAYNVLTMGGVSYPPLPEHLLAKMPDIDHASINNAPVSSGPYVLTSWNHGSSLTFAPNPYYWRGPPKLQTLIWKVLPDTNTLLNQLETHEIDVYPDVDPNLVTQLRNIPDIVIRHRLVASWRHLDMNLSRPLLSDVRVRQAITEGIDWKRINDTIYHGINQLGVSDIFPQSWAAPKLPPYSYDPAHARALLAAAGWKMGNDGVLHRNGEPLHLAISATVSARSNEQSEVMMQQMLRPLGINLTIQNYASSFMFARNGPLYTGKYDLEWSIDTNGADPDNSGWWASQYIPPHGATTTWLRDPLIDRLSVQAASTYDLSTRKSLYQREEERLRQLMPTVVFYWETNYYGLNPDVRGFQPSAFIGSTWNAWEWSI